MTGDVLSVLLVEDSAPIRARLRDTVGSVSGARIVGEAETGEAALEQHQALRPAVLIVDLRLAGRLTGLDVLRRVKDESDPPTVIVLTNSTRPEYRAACAAAGADHFLDKTAEFDRVAPILRTAFRVSDKA